MKELRCWEGNKAYLAPGKAVTYLPVFGGSSASFVEGSPNEVSTTNSLFYSYIDGLFNNDGQKYITDISSPFIKNLYAKRTIYLHGVATPLLYRRYTKIYYGFVTGRGGSGGGSNSYMADERTGGGGGAGGCAIFYISVASDDVKITTSGAEITFTSGDYTIQFVGLAGSNGGAGSGACTGGGGGGGAGARSSAYIGDSYYTSPSGKGSETEIYGQYGPFYYAAILSTGTSGASGGTWGDRPDAADNSFSFSTNFKRILGMQVDASIGWNRSDGHNGSSIAPGIKASSDANATWYGSGGGQSAAAKYWTYTISLE